MTNVNGDNVDLLEIDGQLNDGLNDIELSNDEELIEVSSPNVQAVEEKEVQEIENEVVEDAEPPQYETIKTEDFDDTESLNQEEVASQVSDDQDESTVINNDNYDNNNDSAYETNEINSQNGSESRLQSADTNEGDVDTETGENFLLQTEIENIERQDLENLEIERLENDLENPPTPIDDDDFDVVVSAGNPTKTGDSTAVDNDEVGKDEVH